MKIITGKVVQPVKKRNILGNRRKLLIGLLLASIIIGVVFAAAYIQMQWTITATVSANPSASFYLWSGPTKVNTFDYAINIFPDITTVDENITHGIFNDDASVRQCYMRVYALNVTANIDSLNVTVYTTGSQFWTKKWTSFASLPTTWEDMGSLAANTKYSIWLEVECATGASGDVGFTLEMKEMSP